ncbi:MULTISPECIES: TetR/AcrR family transcriptional regulator [unclassified Frankia]|uniref:TetR/AcrR family transcriptional regulator n=1 Tax=unclassified Frankia TaxID=2632575 RepID=UPI001EF6BE3C|nr:MULTISPECIES: TetR/AcrR family transcriptional regulator [unclassified Frankia]
MVRPTLDSSRSGGRPRDDSRDGAIRRATLQLLAEVGYDGVTMDRVATRAKAGKATIYRRWPSKVALVMDAITTITEQSVPIPDTGSFRMDMLAFISSFRDAIGDDRGRIIAELVSEMPRNSELREALRNGLLAQRKTASDVIVHRGIVRGEISAEVDHTVLMELGPALVLQRVLLSGEVVDAAFMERIVDDLIVPYAVHGLADQPTR